MTELDAELGPLALELINDYGKSIVYQQTTTKTYDPATSETSGAQPDPINLKAIVEDFSAFKWKGDLIEGGNKKLTVAAQSFSFEPGSGDFVTFDGKKRLVLGRNAIYSGELVCVYELATA